MAKKEKGKNTSDRVTKYAKDVVAGKIIAGPGVRAACKRHLKDLRRKNIYFDVDAAEWVFGFFRDVLHLNGGEFEGQPFELLEWQAFIVGSLFGWKKKGGYRRFTKAFVETGKGSGKSPLAAAIGLYMMVADDESRAEVYSAAVDKDQAKILFKDAVAMVEQSEDLTDEIVISGGSNPHNLAYLKTSSLFRPLSTENAGKGKSGFRVHCGLLDEVHEHRTSAMVEFVDANQKGRRQPLTFQITNSGSDKTSVCWEYHVYALKVAAGEIKDETFFSYVCALDEGEEPFKNEKCWIKVNPSLGVTIRHDYLRKQVREAKGLPSKENLVRRLNFCQWTDAEESWIGREVWESIEVEIDDLDFLRGRECFGGFDLGAKRDMTSCALVFPFEAGEWDGLPEGGNLGIVFFWSPKDTLRERAERDRAPYDVWEREKFLFAPPGKTTDYRFVAREVGKFIGLYSFRIAAYDRWHIDDLIRELDAEGIDVGTEKDHAALTLVPFGQGFKDMSPAVNGLEEEILTGQLKVLKNPVLRWNAASAVIEEDAAGNRKFTKKKATGLIDGLVALTQADAMARRFSTEPGLITEVDVMAI